MQANRTDIRSLSIENLCSTLSKSNFPAYRSKQIKNWARKIDVKSFEQMSNLPKDLVSYLETNFSLNKSKIISHQKVVIILLNMQFNYMMVWLLNLY